MTERIAALKRYQWDKRHHAFRVKEAPDASGYQRTGLPDYERTALRLKASLEAEAPVLLPGELIAFTRTVPALPMIYTKQEWEDIRKKHTIHENGNVCNLSPDYAPVIASGLLALRDKLTDAPYHRAMAKSIDAVLDLTGRYHQEALKAGDMALAKVLARVPAHGARSFREALQSLRVLHFAMWCEGNYHNTLGRFDQYMMPYLEADLKAGNITQDGAFELLEAFFLACNRDSDLYPGMQQGDNGQSMVLGGITPEGKDGFNLLSEMCLKACQDLKLIDPKINLRVSSQTPLEVFELGTELTRLGLGFPQYENDDVAIPGLMRLGYEEQDARDYAVAACWEFIIPGKGMDVPNIGALSFAEVVSDALKEALPDAASMKEVTQAVEAVIFARVSELAGSFGSLYIIPSPFMSLFFEGCLDKGRDISLGCKYNNYGFHGTGLATAADMLAAVEKAVFEEGLPVPVLFAALEEDFKGYEALRDTLRYDSPKMGNDDDKADRYAVGLLDMFSRAVEGHRNERGGIFRAGTGSAMYYVWHGSELGATPDGRRKGEPLPANYSPSLNVRLNGPLSLIKSFTKPDLSRVINGGPLTIEFSDTVFRNEEAIRKVAQLVMMFIRLGGHQLQLNTVNRDQLLDAQEHPGRHRDLIVRVWGWSGYFVELDKCYQDHIISRTELGV
ncbi:MAG: pyruvate formate lyase family protein [Eubacteriales bacterium]|nr:pyruvate formate lyase family protein [Eubacteriales bacterium]